MSVLTDLIYGGSHAVAGLTRAPSTTQSPSTAQTRPLPSPTRPTSSPPSTPATGVKDGPKLGDRPPGVGVLKSLITDQRTSARR